MILKFQGRDIWFLRRVRNLYNIIFLLVCMATPLQPKSSVTDYSKPSDPKAQQTPVASIGSNPLATTPTSTTSASSTPNQTSQPGAVQQPAVAKSKNWIWWTIGGVVLVIIIGLGIWYAFFRA
mgnify:CR=1 FL=1